MRKQRKKSWFNGLSLLQQEFVNLYCDGLSDTFGNILSSWLKAGYTQNDNQALNRQSAVKVYKSAKIQRAISAYQAEKWDKVDVSREITLSRLVDTYDRAVASGDSSAQVSCVKLMMQYNQLLNVNINLNLEYQQEFDNTLQVECQELASVRIKSIIDGSGSVSLSPADASASAFLPSASISDLISPVESVGVPVASGAVCDGADDSEKADIDS